MTLLLGGVDPPPSKSALLLGGVDPPPSKSALLLGGVWPQHITNFHEIVPESTISW